MAIVARQPRSSMGRPSQNSQQAYNMPASVGGMNALQGLSMMPPEDCIYCHNLMPSEYGMRTRRGYKEWASIPTGKPIRTLIPFEGQAKDASADKLWAVTEDGIYEVSVFGTVAPVLVLPFGTQSADAGWGVWTEFTTLDNERFLQYADEENGLFSYSETDGLWEVPNITGPEVTNIAFVTAWKNRLWFIEKNAGEAWYLEINSKSGTATQFTFGSKFEHGGDLLALFSWTIDGGAGIDDFMVVISRGGDILIYKGFDPDVAVNFQLHGSWFVGEFPESRRVGIAYGGEFYLLSTYGVTSLRDLLQGVDPLQPGSGPATKINRLLRDAVEDHKDDREWAMHVYPSDGFLQILLPYSATDIPSTRQLTQNLTTRAWGFWRGVPANCSAAWSGRYYTGGKDGSVWQYTGVTDGATLDGSVVGKGIDYDVLTSFQAAGDPTSFKRVGFIRPILIQGAPGALNVAAVYDYAIGAQLGAPNTPTVDPDSAWDTAKWDETLWDFTQNATSLPIGSLGMGRTVAVAMRGTATSRLTFVGWDLSYTSGGFL